MSEFDAVGDLRFLANIHQQALPMFASFHGHLAQRGEVQPIPWTVSDLPQDKAAFTVDFLGKTVKAVLSVDRSQGQACIKFFELEVQDPTFKLPLGEVQFTSSESGILVEERVGRDGSTCFPNISDPEEAVGQMASFMLKVFDGHSFA